MALTDINPGDTWATVYAAGSAGDTYTIKAGTHRQQSINVTRDNDIFILETGAGYTGAICTGGELLTGWTNTTGNEYSATFTEAAEDTAQASESGWGANSGRHDLFVDLGDGNGPQRMKQMAASGSLNAGEWFHEDGVAVHLRMTNDADPDTATSVEIGRLSVANGARAFKDGGATGVTIKSDNIPTTTAATLYGTLDNWPVIESYATDYGQGCVDIGQGWTVQGIEIRNNHSCGIEAGRVSEGGEDISYNRIRNNGQLGALGTPSSGYVFRNNEVSFNNENRYAKGVSSGGTKFLSTKANAFGDGDFSITNEYYDNWVHGNYDVGSWWDTACGNDDIYSNLIENNDSRAIFYEIAPGPAKIHNNTMRDNSADGKTRGALRAADVFISCSSKVEVFENVIHWNNPEQEGISLLRDERPRTSGIPAITGISKANPAVVTVASEHQLETGHIFQLLTLNGGMVELLTGRYQVTRISSTQFSLDGEDSTGYTVWTSAGTWREDRESTNCNVHDNTIVYYGSATAGQFLLALNDTHASGVTDAESVGANNFFTNNVSHVTSTGETDYQWGNSAETLTSFNASSANASGNTETTDAFGTLGYILPNANSGTTNWVEGVGDGDGDWYDELDEGMGIGRGTGTGPDDATSYWRSPINPTTETISVALQNTNDPVASLNHVARFRIKKSASGGTAITAVVRLLEGVTTRASTSVTAATLDDGLWQDAEIALSAAEADAITDYNDLILQVEASNDSTAGNRRLFWSAGELQLPASISPPPAGSLTPPLGRVRNALLRR